MIYKQYESEGICYILLKDIALAWYPNNQAKNMTSPVRKKLEAAGIAVKRPRLFVTAESGKALMMQYWAVLVEDLDKIENMKPQSALSYIEEDDIKYGCTFYIIQKYPEDAPSIIKMGKTTKTAEARSKAFYVWNPKILREFPISPNDEKTLIRMISKGNKQIGDEEFVITNMDDMLNKADIIAALLSCNDDDEDDD